MLLSFFIILCALSNYEEAKARPVVNSLSIAFSSKDNVEELSPNVESDPIQSHRDGDALDKLRELFKAQISGLEVNENRLGTMMHMRLEQDKFDEILITPLSRAENLSSFDGDFLPVLISLLDSQDSISYRMDVVVNVKEEPADLKQNEPELFESEVDKAASYANVMESAGLPQPLVTAGLRAGKPGFVDIYFRRYEPFNPVGVE